MRVAVVGLQRRIIERQMRKFDFKIDRKKPEVVVSFGGDGTLLYAERLYPSVPKLMIRHKSDCIDCSRHYHSLILRLLAGRKYRTVEKIKLEGVVNGKKLIGLNEICVQNKIPQAIRLQVSVDGKKTADYVRGDGLVVATPFGSTAYFYSITYKKFTRGLGIAFNNPAEKMKPIFVNENTVVKVKILRGPGFMCTDNDKRMLPIKTGDVITIKKSSRAAKFIELK